MLGISGGVQKVGDHPDAGARCRRIGAVGYARGKVLEGKDRSGSFRSTSPIEVEGITGGKKQRWGSEAAYGLQDAIGVVSVVNHEQGARICGDGCGGGGVTGR